MHLFTKKELPSLNYKHKGIHYNNLGCMAAMFNNLDDIIYLINHFSNQFLLCVTLLEILSS